MENASKALIIAGAILLAILIISLGILIYNQAAGVVNNNAMSQVETQQFNQQFTQYEGDVRGATVNSMLQAVLSNNMGADSADRQVEVYSAGSEGIALKEDATGLPATKAKSGSTYTVTCEYSTSGGDKGLVKKIKIQEK